MTAATLTSASRAGSRPIGRVRLSRALAAVPAVIGSLLLLTVLFGWLGRWEAPVLLGWLASGALVRSSVGERMAVRVGWGFRRPSTSETAALAPLWAAAIRQTGTVAGDVDLYVQRCGKANAYTAGARSVAVTTGVLRHFEAHRLTEEQVVAVLVHELGHYATRATRWGLVALWLAAPWRLATRSLVRIELALCGRQPRPLLALVMCAGVVMAVVQAVTQQNWIVAGVLAGVTALSVVCPLADAAVSRRDEWVADRFTADHGLARPLAAALRALHGDHHAPFGWLRRLLASHPDLDRRIDALLAPVAEADREDHVIVTVGSA